MTAVWKTLMVLWWNLWAQGQPSPARELLASRCESCHPQHVSQWRESRHAVAFTNGLFRAEFDARRTAWCASCHAPAAPDPRVVADDDALAMEGVGCMSCHWGRGGRLVSSRKAPGSPHQTQVSEEFGSAAFCGSCHEFNFPVMGGDGMPVGFQALAMQETVSEFRDTASARRGEDCRSCHMQPGQGGHRFLGSHDLPTLQSALEWDSCTTGEVVNVDIANIGAAHDVPTGGVNRHMVLRLWQSESPQTMVEHFIGRRFAGDEEGDKTLVLDTSLAAGESRRFAAHIPAMAPVAGEPVNIELRYIYPLDEFAELDPGTHRFTTVFRERKPVSALPPCEQP